MFLRSVPEKLRSSPLVKLVLGFFTFVVLTLVSPFRHVRLGYLHADSLGGFISQSDMILSLRSQHSFQKYASAVQIFILPRTQANSFVVDHYVSHIHSAWSRCLVLSPSSHGLRFLEICTLALAHLATQTGRFARHYCGAPLRPGLDARAYVEDLRPHKYFAKERANQLWDQLEVIGLTSDEPYICFDHRSPDYWDEHADIRRAADGGGRTQDFRNVPTDNYLDALNEVRERGLNIVRVGFHKFPDPQLDAIGIIDYATSSIRSAELDTFLFGQAKAAIFAGASGIAQLATSQHIPTFVADYRPFTQTEWGTPNCCLMPGLLWDARAGSVLRARDMLQLPFNVDSMYQERDISFVCNSSIDIRQGVDAFLATVLDGAPQPNDELQVRFWTLVAEERPNYTWQPRPPRRRVKIRLPFDPAEYGLTSRRSWIPPSFLRRYSDVLGLDQDSSPCGRD